MRVAIYSQRPVVVAGITAMLPYDAELIATWADEGIMLDSLRVGGALDVLLMDCPAVRLAEEARFFVRVAAMLDSASLGFAARMMALGVSGILPIATSAEHLGACLRQVAGGAIYIRPDVVPELCVSRRLTHRQRNIAALVGIGLRSKEIGARLGITEGTVKVYLSRLYRHLNVDSRLGLYDVVRRNAAPDGSIPEWIQLRREE